MTESHDTRTREKEAGTSLKKTINHTRKTETASERASERARERERERE